MVEGGKKVFDNNKVVLSDNENSKQLKTLEELLT